MPGRVVIHKKFVDEIFGDAELPATQQNDVSTSPDKGFRSFDY